MDGSGNEFIICNDEVDDIALLLIRLHGLFRNGVL
jgi:hypothetical protein